MPPVTDANVDTSKLRSLYANDATARAILDYLRKMERNRGVSTVARLISKLSDSGVRITRGQVIATLRQLEQLNCGTFKAGRRGKESRIVWQVSSKGVGEAAAGMITEVPKEILAIGETNELSADEANGLLTHRFQLRPQMAVTLELPTDLSAHEAERLEPILRRCHLLQLP